MDIVFCSVDAAAVALVVAVVIVVVIDAAVVIDVVDVVVVNHVNAIAFFICTIRPKLHRVSEDSATACFQPLGNHYLNIIVTFTQFDTQCDTRQAKSRMRCDQTPCAGILTPSISVQPAPSLKWIRQRQLRDITLQLQKPRKI